MYDEDLFQEFLKERERISPKKKRVNTDRAVKMLRTKLETFYHEGYDCDLIIRRSLGENESNSPWLGVFRPKGVEPKQRPLKPKGRLKEMVDSCYKKPPKPANPEHQRKAVEALRQILAENK